MIRFEKVSFEQYYIDRKKSDKYITKPQAEEEYKYIRLPKRATVDSAGYDFFAPYAFDLHKYYANFDYHDIRKNPVLIPTGIRWVTDNKDVVLLMFPRSSLGFMHNFSLYNTVGVIDSGYFCSDNEGHIMAKVSANDNISIEQGKAFMQGIIVPFIKTDDDDTTEIRNGGLGSTDKK